MFRIIMITLRGIILAVGLGTIVGGFSINQLALVQARDYDSRIPRDQLDGKWEVVELIRGDLAARVLPDEDMAGAVEFDGEHFRFIKTSLGQELDRLEATVSIDYSQSPGMIELKFVSGPDSGRTAAGIFELNGDELQICLPIRSPFDDRPTEFAAGQGSNRALFTLRRIR